MKRTALWVCGVGALAWGVGAQAAIAQEDAAPEAAITAEAEPAEKEGAGEERIQSQLAKDIAALKEEVDDLNATLRSGGILDSSKQETRAICDIANGLCTPDSVGLNGDTRTSIVLRGLSSFCGVRATANETFAEPDLNDDRLEASRLGLKTLPDQVLLELHLNTVFVPSYGGFSKGRGHRNAMARLRPKDVVRNSLSLLVHHSVRSVIVTATSCEKKPEDPPARTATVELPVSVSKWEIEGGGFYAFSRGSDEGLISETVAADSGEGEEDATEDVTVRILRKSAGDDYRSDTGVGVNFYPANYPFLGFSFGIADNGDRSPTYFLGSGFRLLSLGHRAVVSMTAGGALVRLKSFPGVETGDELAADSRLLDGEVTSKVRPFVSIHLGFSIGGGPKNGAEAP
jgi:hypothetical protein